MTVVDTPTAAAAWGMAFGTDISTRRSQRNAEPATDSR